VNPQQIAVLVVAATLGLLVVLLLLYGRPRKTATEPLPANFNRGDPDSVLENTRLSRMQVWAVASAFILAAMLVGYFMLEPFREASYGKKFFAASVARGEEQFRPDATKGQTGANCASCHGPQGEGGFAATDPNWPAPPLNNEFARYTIDEITRIIKQGRPGTPMPAWGIEFGGPLNDQKIEDVVDFMATIQVKDKYELAASVKDGKEIFARKCAVCHGPNARGQALGQPLPTFFAPDLTTEYYRLGLKVQRVNVTIELKNKLAAAHSDQTEPTTEEVDAAMAKLSSAEIMKAGRQAAENTILRGRPNTPMPPWQNRIRPEQVQAVLKYLDSIQRMPS
jgi:mono/diheme cytochrome c family protein